MEGILNSPYAMIYEDVLIDTVTSKYKQKILVSALSTVLLGRKPVVASRALLISIARRLPMKNTVSVSVFSPHSGLSFD